MARVERSKNQYELKMSRVSILLALLAAFVACAVAQPAADRVTSLPNLVRNHYGLPRFVLEHHLL